MTLSIKKKKIATKDIKCYKEFSSDSKNKRRIIGYYQENFLWWDIRRKSNIVYKKTILDIPSMDSSVLYNGFHSYSNKKEIIITHNYKHIAYECIIPKGAEYYYDHINKEYISNELIVQLDKPIKNC